MRLARHRIDVGMDLQYINVIQMLTKPNQTFESDKYHSSNVDGSFVTKKVVLANVFCVSFLIRIQKWTSGFYVVNNFY